MKASNTAKVLVVDDMGTMRKLVIRSLKEIGFELFTEASDGEKAWQKLQEEQFTFVVSDWNMPNVTGLELLKRIKQDTKLAALPVIMLTAESEKGQVVDAIKSGASGYIVKPFSTQSLKETIDKI